MADSSGSHDAARAAIEWACDRSGDVDAGPSCGLNGAKRAVKRMASAAGELARCSLGSLDAAIKDLVEWRSQGLGDGSFKCDACLVFLLAAVVKTYPRWLDVGENVGTIQKFLKDCRKECAHLAAEPFIAVCKSYAASKHVKNNPASALRALKGGILKLRTAPDRLTSLHPIFFQCCILAKHYHYPRKLLDSPITELEGGPGSPTLTDYLLFCYYGSLLHIGLKQYKRAILLLQHAITAPSSSLSAITIAAYKKYCVVSLLEMGAIKPISKYAASTAHRNLKGCCLEYTELGKVFQNLNSVELASLVLQHEEIYRRDGNLGLVQLLVAAACRSNIQRLTQTYLTYSLEDIAVCAGMDSSHDAETCTLNMIEVKEIVATIDKENGMVHFLEDPEQSLGGNVSRWITDGIRNIMQLDTKIASIDESISCDGTYLYKTVGKDKKWERFGPWADLG